MDLPTPVETHFDAPLAELQTESTEILPVEKAAIGHTALEGAIEADETVITRGTYLQ